jgi:hypothetical protein
VRPGARGLTIEPITETRGSLRRRGSAEAVDDGHQLFGSRGFRRIAAAFVGIGDEGDRGQPRGSAVFVTSMTGIAPVDLAAFIMGETGDWR